MSRRGHVLAVLVALDWQGYLLDPLGLGGKDGRGRSPASASSQRS
jgi:hypothetical protein